MPKNTSMTLDPHFEEFISKRVSKGRYGSASEVVRAGLRLLENSETNLETLRTLLSGGEKSGFAEYSYDNLIQGLDDEG